MRRKIIAVIVGMGIFVLGALFTYFIAGIGEDVNWYSGKVIFETEEEYSTFKRIVGQPCVYVKEIEVLSSDPPVVVIFEVKVVGSGFPYGQKEPNNSAVVVPFGVLTSGVLGFSISRVIWAKRGE